MVSAEGSARAAAPIGADVEAVMNGLRANDQVGFCRSARVRPRSGADSIDSKNFRRYYGSTTFLRPHRERQGNTGMAIGKAPHPIGCRH